MRAVGAGLWYRLRFSRAGEFGSRPCQKSRGELGWFTLNGDEPAGELSPPTSFPCRRQMMVKKSKPGSEPWIGESWVSCGG